MMNQANKNLILLISLVLISAFIVLIFKNQTMNRSIQMLDQRIHELQSDIDNLNLKFDRMRTMTYSELNAIISEDSITSPIESNSTLNLTCDKEKMDINNLARSLLEAEKVVPEVRRFEFNITNCKFDDPNESSLNALIPIKMQEFSLYDNFALKTNDILPYLLRVTSSLILEGMFIDQNELEEIFKRSSHLKSLSLRRCRFYSISNLNFRVNTTFSIKELDFTGLSSENGNSLEIMQEIIEAISKYSLADSLVKIKLDFNQDQLNSTKRMMYRYGLSKIELVNASQI